MSSPTPATVKFTKQRLNFRRSWPFHLMLLPGVIFVLLFQYLPMAGLVIAFQDFKPWTGFIHSPWVGLEHFRSLFERPDSKQVIWNTVVISLLRWVFGLVAPFLFALLLNEVRQVTFKRTVQTMVYLPHFLPWVILGGILIDLLSIEGGLVNRIIGAVFGIEPIFFLGEGNWFRVTIVISDVWKECGFGAIIFLAALAGIKPTLYEAALMDGASRWKQTLYITIPSLIPIFIVVGTLSLGTILNTGFDQIFNLYNPLVYDKGDVIDTFVYRMAIVGGKMSFGTAVGLLKSFIGFALIVIGYRLAYTFAGYRIF
ncbi:sugar ABC transporter permease [Paenibacillus sp. CF384]|uniref:ABC transporter permease n=1 Tax=Paenibacillus sp. CF384 TaxID=1884382 RepID=UPI0008987615|nr:ABC transporter permease subunit [Paenibacillus sp. CF384]SDX93205.1 putative aldouronate transport system permease protein [Paenibacillus sp. CF384]